MSVPDTPLTVRTVTGLDTTGGEGFFVEPAWTAPSDTIDFGSFFIEGRSTKVKPSTKVGPTVARSSGDRNKLGGHRWSGNFLFRPYTHARLYTLFDNMRRWQGRVMPFWMPSWSSDFRIVRNVDPLEGDVVHVLPNGFEWLFEDSRYGLMIETFDRFLDIYEIVGYDSATGHLFVRDTLKVLIELTNIARVCLVRRVRSDSNTFDWRYLTDAIAEVPLGVREVLGEGLFLP